MQTKLTLRLDDALIERAKLWAKEHKVSLSVAVAHYFAQLPREQALLSLAGWTRKLAGAAATELPEPPDEAAREDYRAHVERKHR